MMVAARHRCPACSQDARVHVAADHVECDACGACFSLDGTRVAPCWDCAELTPVAELQSSRCESCHDSSQRARARDRRVLEADGHGDWMRDRQRGGAL